MPSPESCGRLLIPGLPSSSFPLPVFRKHLCGTEGFNAHAAVPRYSWFPLLCSEQKGAPDPHPPTAAALLFPGKRCLSLLPLSPIQIPASGKLFKGLGQRGVRGEDWAWWGASSLLNEQRRERGREWKRRGEGFKALLCTEGAGWGGGEAYSCPGLCPPCPLPKSCDLPLLPCLPISSRLYLPWFPASPSHDWAFAFLRGGGAFKITQAESRS